VTYITIAHRPALRAYHDNMLAIGDGRQGFTLSKVDRTAASKRTLQMAQRSVVSDETEKSIRAHAEKRSAQYKDARGIKKMPDNPTLKRFLRLFKLGLPDHFALRMVGLFSLIGLQTAVEDYTFVSSVLIECFS
jgi:hypothetical protein